MQPPSMLACSMHVQSRAISSQRAHIYGHKTVRVRNYPPQKTRTEAWGAPLHYRSKLCPRGSPHNRLGGGGHTSWLGRLCALCAAAAHGGCRRRPPKCGRRDAGDVGDGAVPAMGVRKYTTSARRSQQAMGRQQRADGSVRVMMKGEEWRREEGVRGGFDRRAMHLEGLEAAEEGRGGHRDVDPRHPGYLRG